MSDTATAHEDWDQRWQTDAGRADWLMPVADVVQFAASLTPPIKALDLGCGVGRHALHFAQLGFETAAVDGSAAGIAYAQAQARDRDLVINFTQGLMNELPYETAFFDYVLAFNVIYHGDVSVVRQCLQEIQRVLKPGGFFQGTMLSKRNHNYGQGNEVAPNTFVRPDDGEKAHPHFYCNASELCHLLTGFEVLSLVDQVHEKPDSWHWHLIAQRQ